MMYGNLLTGAAVAAALLPGTVRAVPEGHGPGCVAPAFIGADGTGFARSGHAHRSDPAAPPALAPASTVGPVHMLTILAAFSDIPPRIQQARFDTQLYGPAPSVADYYREASGDRLTLTGDVFGWVTLPQSQAFYSGGAAGVGSYPNNGQKMAEDAVLAAVLAGLQLDDYDADGDGIVDVLHIIHSGQGFEWAGATGPGAPSSDPDPGSINSHKWVVVNGALGAVTQVQDYFTTPELLLARPAAAPAWTDSIATIGVLCHELGHILGLPDFYDTGTFDNNLSIWGLMDFGTWNRIPTDPTVSAPGALPGHPSLWSKMFLGWTTPVELAPGVGEATSETVALNSINDGGRGLQLLTNPDGVDWNQQQPGRGEYFLAEMRTQTGYDAGLPTEGLIIYHVDESRPNNNAAANGDGGALLRVVAEDGDARITSQPAGDPTGDPWPGVQSAFSATSNPTSRLWDGSESGVSMVSMTGPSGGAVSFLAEVSNLQTAVALPFARPNPFGPEVHGAVTLVLNLGTSASTTRVSIHDARGRLVRTLRAGDDFSATDRIVQW
ncbi:MAG: M6 family metalloprotease domain-containing protein, partial [Gemmatimonadetes bacterium]|nr:M6 family metalloprotease domain-containing protein [Gemmatimonadota bacterium]